MAICCQQQLQVLVDLADAFSNAMVAPTPAALTAGDRVLWPHCLQINPILTECLCVVALDLLHHAHFQQMQPSILPQPSLNHEESFITPSQSEKLNFCFLLWRYNLFFLLNFSTPTMPILKSQHPD